MATTPTNNTDSVWTEENLHRLRVWAETRASQGWGRPLVLRYEWRDDEHD